MKLTANNVNEVFKSCLFSDGENTEHLTIGKGVTLHVGFKTESLTSHQSDIKNMLSNLPDSFKKSGGGGMTFLNIVEDKNGMQWCDLHQTADELITMGNALGLVSYPMPREMWDILPGGVPYVCVDV